MRTLLIAGNWKLNPTTTEAAVTLAEGVKTGLGTATDVHVAVAPPFVFLSRIDEVLKNTPIGLAAQDMHWENSGAFTGEVSGAMLVDVGCTHVILGHSERRHGMGETSAMVNKKLLAALEAKLIPTSASASSRRSGWPSRPRPCCWTNSPTRWPGSHPSKWPARSWPMNRSGRSARA